MKSILHHFHIIGCAANFFCIFLIVSPASALDCNEKWTDKYYVLEPECIDFYFEDLAPAVLYVFEASENHRETARSITSLTWTALQITQILVITFGATATLMIAFGDVISIGKMKIGPWAVIPTTIVTILTSVATFYDWRGERGQQYLLAQEMATQRSQMNLDLLFLIGDGRTPDEISKTMLTIRRMGQPDEEVDLQTYVQRAHDDLDRALRSFQSEALKRMDNLAIGGSE